MSGWLSRWWLPLGRGRLAAHELESPLMSLDETMSIMETMDTVLALARRVA